MRGVPNHKKLAMGAWQMQGVTTCARIAEMVRERAAMATGGGVEPVDVHELIGEVIRQSDFTSDELVIVGILCDSLRTFANREYSIRATSEEQQLRITPTKRKAAAKGWSVRRGGVEEAQRDTREPHEWLIGVTGAPKE